jgi:hypothetical protein
MPVPTAVPPKAIRLNDQVYYLLLLIHDLAG